MVMLNARAVSGHCVIAPLGPGSTRAADLIAQKKATRDTPPPIIYITGLALERQQASPMETGAVGVIAKPFDPFLLPRRVRQLIDATLPAARSMRSKRRSRPARTTVAGRALRSVKAHLAFRCSGAPAGAM